jgi:predicted Fe-Mo cluster-binding NifX family protein
MSNNGVGEMKVCITAQGPTPAARVEDRFGRAPYFIIMDTETRSFEALENRFAGAYGGVGPKAAQLLIAHGVEALVSGQVGGNARDVLFAAGVAMFTYHGGGSVAEAFEEFIGNRLERAG